MSGRFVPVPTPETRTYWDKAAEGELWLPRCGPCARFFFYPRSFCPRCGSDEVSWARTSGRGTVESFVINHRAAPGYERDVPYAIAFVKLAEGPRLTANILGVAQTPDHIHVGLPVEVAFEKRGDLTLPQFRPTIGEGARP